MSFGGSHTNDDSCWLINTLVVIGIAVSLGLIAVSAVLNFRVGYRTADTEFDGWVYGLGAGMADALKAIAPFVAFWGWRNKDSLAVGAATTVFLVFSAYSFSAALGFAAHHRVVKQGEESGAFEKRKDTRAEFDRIDTRLKSLGMQRSEGEIDKAVASVLARVVGERGRTVDQISSGCTLNRKDSREACAEVAALGEEAERSREYVRLGKLAKQLRDKLDSLKVGNASGDPQIGALEELSNMTPWPQTRKKLEVGLSLLVALFIELGSGLGLYVATTPWRSSGEHKKAEGKGSKHKPKAKGARAMKLGAVEEFMLEGLERRQGGQLSGGDLFMAYRRWCTSKTVVPYGRKEFRRQFANLAAMAGISQSGVNGSGVYRDVVISR